MPGHRTRAFRISAAALALCALLAGCSGSAESADGGKVVLRYTWWGNPDRAERTERAVALFEERHPDIEVRTSFSGYDAYKQKLATQAAGGDAPDVMQLDYRQIDQYASGGVLLDLAKQRDALRTSAIDPGLLATGRVDGTQYAVPQGRGTETVVYDVTAWKASGCRCRARAGAGTSGPTPCAHWPGRPAGPAPSTRARARTPSRSGCADRASPSTPGTAGWASRSTT